MALARRAMVLLLALQSALLLQHQLVAGQECRQQLVQAVPGSADVQDNIDAATPADACLKKLNGFDAAYQLVFSDEFNGNGLDQTVWRAEDLYYKPTNDEEVYKPEQIKVEGGAAVITIEKGRASAYSQQPNGEMWKYTKDYKSGMMTTWDKFCYTGGYLEAAVQLPGNDKSSGFWPAFWTMGVLGRAGYMQSTEGTWPYSYNQCDGSGKQAWDMLPGQRITACPNETSVESGCGLNELQGRGAPEFDVMEVAVPPNNDGAQYSPPTASQTLQMAPIMPEGVNWWSTGGVQYPGADSDYNTRLNPWRGALGRPGNLYQDSISALSNLGPSYYTGFHTYGVDWRPGEYLRWYIDGQFLYEVNKQALLEQTNGTGAWVGTRLIPLEPMYIILNLGLSNDFGVIEWDKLPFPSQMKIDWVRVYQRPDSINVGCSPPDFPTAEYIQCNSRKYNSALGAAAVQTKVLLGSVLAAVLFLLLAP